jgi:hypothetical protein
MKTPTAASALRVRPCAPAAAGGEGHRRRDGGIGDRVPPEAEGAEFPTFWFRIGAQDTPR